MLEPELLTWKYWETWPLWPHPCSYVMEREGQIVAHAGVMPLTVHAGDSFATLLHPFDWVSAPAAVGSGAALFKRLATLADGLVVVGGSQMTRRMAAPLGFRRLAPVQCFAIEQSQVVTSTSHESPSVRPVRDGDTLPEDLAEGWREQTATAASPRGVVERWCSCPAAAVQCVEVTQGTTRLGYALLARVPGQARILEWSAISAEARASVVAAVTQFAAALEGVAEVVAFAVTPSEVAVFTQNGFDALEPLPVFLLSGPPSLGTGAALRVQMLHGDLGYLHHGCPERWRGTTSE